MKKLNIQAVKKIVPALLLGIISIAANAQKLPKVQTKSVYAPANIKIDGKATEWDGKYEAFDTKNNIYYTIANDNNNLYLLIHTAEKQTINKIFLGGITFTIISARHSPVSVTYPHAGNNGTYLHTKQGFDDMKKKSQVNAKAINDIIRLRNTEFESGHKVLAIRGVAEFTDPWISIYNDTGIKVKALFDDDLDYTYEMALPLKYLPGGPANLIKLKYDIQLNGLYLGDGRWRPPSPTQGINTTTGEVIQFKSDMNMLYTENPTNFGGEYTLAKK